MNCQRVVYIIADDHPLVAFALRHMIIDSFNINGDQIINFNESNNLVEACKEMKGLEKIIFLDLTIPGKLKKLNILKNLLDIDHISKIIIYTAENSAFLAKSAMDVGALYFVSKTSPLSELMNSIASAHMGKKFIDHNIDMNVINHHQWTHLTKRERAILIALAHGKKIHEISQIMHRSYSTIATHKYNALSKIGINNENDVFYYIIKNGLSHEMDYN